MFVYPVPTDYTAATMREAMRRLAGVGATDDALNVVLTAIVAIVAQNSIKG